MLLSIMFPTLIITGIMTPGDKQELINSMISSAKVVGSCLYMFLFVCFMKFSELYFSLHPQLLHQL